MALSSQKPTENQECSNQPEAPNDQEGAEWPGMHQATNRTPLVRRTLNGQDIEPQLGTEQRGERRVAGRELRIARRALNSQQGAEWLGDHWEIRRRRITRRASSSQERAELDAQFCRYKSNAQFSEYTFFQ